jgi:uncharacterized protein YlaN (UPF0358 family)
MKFEDFTQGERTIIAEFVYSYDNLILIKPDALALVNVFVKYDLVDKEHGEDLINKINKNDFVLEEMIEILFTSVEEEEGKKIMKEYFGN